MIVFVAGSTGVLGRRLVDRLADRGHDVVGLVRDDAGAERVRERGGRPRYGDVLEPAGLREAAEGADVVVHAATAIPTGRRPSAADRERNDRVRIEGTRTLLDAADAVGADRVVLQSVVWVARRPDGRPFDETAEPNPDRTTRSALDAERLLVHGAGERGLERVRERWLDEGTIRESGDGYEWAEA
ncbi:NAD-dependent epimerase/dehydratase family protein [Salinilacihabitans rarus]|uniref:NAD-dependent epimerase/dehydratase family protein n=1 Tax=Salinilacihabitans rarus TaxID=2961596 RepID=UPI0020C8E20A|nr:NAD(P)H-binding protein [Salinilacihabitans rarus]